MLLSNIVRLCGRESQHPQMSKPPLLSLFIDILARHTALPSVQLQFSGSVTKFYPVVLRGSHGGLVFQEVMVFKASTMLASLTLFFWLECSCLGLKWEPGHKGKGRELKEKKKAEIKG